MEVKGDTVGTSNKQHGGSMSKRFITIAISILFVFCLVPLFAQTPPASQTPPSTNTPGTHDMKSMQGNKMGGDGEIIAFLIAADEHEVAAANDANQKKSDAKVGDFAQMMNKDHSQNLDETRKLSDSQNIQPTETAAIKKMKTEGQAEMTKLSQMQGAAFDKAYMAAMVKGHTDVLNHIDHYMKTATNPQLQSHLKMTRDAVANHLAEAKKVQASLKGGTNSK
jgi:putative membrane protein